MKLPLPSTCTRPPSDWLPSLLSLPGPHFTLALFKSSHPSYWHTHTHTHTHITLTPHCKSSSCSLPLVTIRPSQAFLAATWLSPTRLPTLLCSPLTTTTVLPSAKSSCKKPSLHPSLPPHPLVSLLVCPALPSSHRPPSPLTCSLSVSAPVSLALSAPPSPSLQSHLGCHSRP